MATSDVGHEPRPYRVHVFPALMIRRHGNRGYADFKVRGMWPWLLCEEWKTHDSTWAIPQSSRAHEQFVKTHEHFSKLMSNRWKAMSKIPRENCSWGFQNPHEPSWGLMRAHEFLMRTHEFLMRSSWGKNSRASRLFFVRESVTLSDRCSACRRIYSAISVTSQIYLEEQNWCGRPRWWRRETQRERMGICTWIWQCSHSCALSGNNPKREESNGCFQRAMSRCREPSFLTFTIRACSIRRLLRHHLLPGWSLGQLQALIFY